MNPLHPVNSMALDSFLAARGKPYKERLFIKNNELHYGKIGFGARFAAKLGFGDAAISNVAKFIKHNRDSCLATDNSLYNFNAFINKYNSNHCIGWKKPRKIKVLTQPFKLDDFDLNNANHVHELVKHHLNNCKNIYQNMDSHFVKSLKEGLNDLQMALDLWSVEASAANKEKKQTINEILELKNKIRAGLLPAKNQTLKGNNPIFLNIPLTNDEQKDVKEILKNLQSTMLKKYFKTRLDSDGAKLAQLMVRYEENKNKLPESKFLQEQLTRWQKKLDQGKPIAIPKWFHCTGKTGTHNEKLNVVQKIMDSHILFMHSGAFAGCFVSVKPEHGYGDYCFMISEHIEKTSTKRGSKDHTVVYPKHSQFVGHSIQYSDTYLAPEKDAPMQDNQKDVTIWFSFQRGVLTYNGPNTWGTDGIPIRRAKRVAQGNLKYYEDTTVAFIYHTNDRKELKPIAKKARIRVIKKAEADALRELIKGTFCCTLPTSWQGKLTSC